MLAYYKMSRSASNSAFPLPPRSKNFVGNRKNIGWKHGVDVSGNGKKVKCNYYSKTFNGNIILPELDMTLDLVYQYQKKSKF